MQLQKQKVAKIFCKPLPICTVATVSKAQYCGTVYNPFKPDKTFVKVLHSPLFLYTSNSTTLFESPQAASACPSDKVSLKTKCAWSNCGIILKGKNAYRSTRRETCSFVSFCPPQISDE